MTTRQLAIRLSLKDADVTKRALTQLGDDGQRALKRIESAATPASRGLVLLNAASQEAQTSVAALASRAGPIGNVMSGIGAGGLAAAAGIGALVIGLSAGLTAARTAITAFDEVAESADRIGITTDALQEFRYAADLSGVGAQNMDKALEKLSRKSGEAASGVEEAEKIFKRLGVSVTDAGGNIKTADKLLEELAVKFASMQSPAERAAVAVKLFGDEAGGKMAAMLAQGGAAMAKLRNEARELGVVVDEHVIRRAAETADQMDKLARIISTNVNSAMIDLAPILVGIAETFAAVAGAVRDVVDSFRELENRSTRGLKEKLGELTAARDSLSSGLAVQRTQPTPQPIIRDLGGDNRPAEAVKQGAITQNEQRLAELNAEIARIEGILSGREDSAVRPAPAKPELPRMEKGGSSKDLSAEADKVAEYTQKLLDQKRVLEANEDVRHRIKAVQDAQNMAMDQGRLLTEAERDQISGLADDIKRLEEASKAAAQAQADMKRFGEEVGKTLSTGFADAITKSQNLTDALRNVANALLKVALNAAMRPVENALGNWFGSTFGSILGGAFGGGAAPTPSIGPGTGGLYHTGGVVGRGAPLTKAIDAGHWNGAPRYHGGGVAGLAPGEVPAILKKGEGVFTPDQMAALGAGGGAGGQVFNSSITVNVQGGGGGGSEDHARMGQTVAKAVEEQVRMLVIKEMRQQMRPGGVMRPS